MKVNNKQGHPGRVNRDQLHVEVEKLANRLVKLVPEIIKDPKFDPEDVVVAKTGALAMLHLLAIMAGKPTPAEVYGHTKHDYNPKTLS